jgi:hypothetical protein
MDLGGGIRWSRTLDTAGRVSPSYGGIRGSESGTAILLLGEIQENRGTATI